jgi:hypothetical protein
MDPTDLGMAKRATLADRCLLVGVDFTSAPSRRKPITVAHGRWQSGKPLPSFRLDGIRELETLEAFEEFLLGGSVPGAGADSREPFRREPWIGGFDLPFGQPRSLIEHEGWPTEWPAFVEFFCAQPRAALRDTFRRWCDGRPAGDKFAWRKTDKPAGSSPAMRWTNPPVAWMMHAAIGRMLRAGLSFPAHRFPSGHGRPRAVDRIAFEAYPGFTARKVCRTSYKSDLPAAQTPERARNRRAIIAALVAGSAGLDITLALSPAWSRRLAADGSGDLLDAVICCLQAAHAAALPDDGLPADLDPLEGWIAAVPPPRPEPPEPEPLPRTTADGISPSRSRSPSGTGGPSSPRPRRRR